MNSNTASVRQRRHATGGESDLSSKDGVQLPVWALLDTEIEYDFIHFNNF